MGTVGHFERVVVGESPEYIVREHKRRYRFAGEFVAGSRVLDLGCGSGYGSRMLSDAGAVEVIGLDCDFEAVEAARRRYGGGQGLSFLEGDATNPPRLDPFDLIVSFETIEHVLEPGRLLAGCRSLLVPGGRLILSTPYRQHTEADGRPSNPFHVQEWRTVEFRELLESHFDEVTLFGQMLNLEKRRRLPLPRKLSLPLQAMYGLGLRDAETIFPLPAPRFLGLWKPFPSYLLAVCRVGDSTDS